VAKKHEARNKSEFPKSQRPSRLLKNTFFVILSLMLSCESKNQGAKNLNPDYYFFINGSQDCPNVCHDN